MPRKYVIFLGGWVGTFSLYLSHICFIVCIQKGSMNYESGVLFICKVKIGKFYLHIF